MSTDTAPPASTRSKRPFLIGGLVLLVLVLVGVWFAGRAWADGRADDYTKDFAAWEKEQGAALLSSTTKVPDGTYIIGKDVTTTKAIASQQKGCAAAEKTAADARDAESDVPTVSAGPFGLLSSTLRDAADTSEERSDAVKAYAKRAAEVYEQIHTDCVWNIAFNKRTADEKRSTALYKKAAKYLDKRGPTGPGAQCNLDTCIAYDKSDRVKYAAITRQAYTLDWRNAQKIYKNGCNETSYGKAMCSAFLRATDRFRDTRINFSEVVRTATNSVDNPVFDRANAQWDGVQKDNAALLTSTVK
ncbi:MAG: hypothetical protein EON52_16645, partial [Actinomycetales bacterium]